jgi:hypothetical protein
MSDATQNQKPTPRPRGPEPPDDPDPARRLWSLWRQGQQTRVADFLDQARVRDPEEIAMALRVDQAERCRLGRWVPAEEYLDACQANIDPAISANERQKVPWEPIQGPLEEMQRMLSCGFEWSRAAAGRAQDREPESH